MKYENTVKIFQKVLLIELLILYCFFYYSQQCKQTSFLLAMKIEFNLKLAFVSWNPYTQCYQYSSKMENEISEFQRKTVRNWEKYLEIHWIVVVKKDIRIKLKIVQKNVNFIIQNSRFLKLTVKFTILNFQIFK